MPIRASFRLLLAISAGILPSIALSSVNAESQSLTPEFFEVSAPTAPSEEFVRPAVAIGTQKVEAALQDDPSVWVPDDFDAWAYAFAESSRLQSTRLRIVKVPAYSVAMNSQVKYFVDRFTTKHREVVGLWVRRSGQYLDMIFEVFKAKGIPEDLAFTAMIESGFNPTAVSRVGAKGMWQFMAPTARLYGLRVDRWVDERLDPEKSTVAAARYLGDLYAMFGSWELAKAAYNAGEMKVLRAMSVLGSRDFWELTRGQILRDETKNYVPAIQAATLIGREPERYGFSASQSGPLAYELAPVPQGMQLARVAALAGLSLDALRELNPELWNKQTPPGGTYLLKFPLGTSQRFAEARIQDRKLEADGRPTIKLGVHVVKPRETVRSIAKRYGISVAALARWNELGEGAHLRPGDRLRIASATPAH